MGAYERALNERGIPTYAVGAGGYWGQQQVADLRSYLSALANPRDDLALINVLASPLAGASLDALPIIRTAAKAAGKDLWTALEDAFTGAGGGLASALPEPDAGRVGAFVRRFAEERRAAPRMSLETLIDRAVTLSGYDREVLSLTRGGRRMANVRKLMRLAREFEAERGRDLRGFIDFVDERELLAAREGQAPLEGEGLDAVRLMTVHAAKGLEFPVVCVADLGREGRGDDGALQVSPDGRVGLQVASLGGGSHSAMRMDEIKAEGEALAEEEERRIFYVAMTRAERRLIVSGATDTVKWEEPKPLGTPMDWVWPALAPGAKLLFESGPEGIDERADGVRVRCVLLTPESADEVLPAADRAPAAAAGAVEDVEPPVTSRPEFPPLTEGVPLPVARLSYSALESYKRCPYRFYLERVVKLPRAGEPLGGNAHDGTAAALGGDDGDQLALAAAEVAPEAIGPLVRGTIVHELLERIDFRRPRAPVRAEVERRARANGVVATEEDVRDIGDLIDRFLGSDLCARIRAARRVRLELPFAYELAPDGLGGRSMLMNGVVDVHADEGERLLVVDYKTDALGGRDPVEVCDEKYGGQRLVYALAALRAEVAEVEVAYCFLERPDLTVSERFTQADRVRLESELLGLAGGVISGRFEPTSRPHRELCQFCPGQPALCSWTPDRTLAERPGGETYAAPEPEGSLS
ncbi:MAG: hypothetical protein QOC95_1209, partial [Thermoleophilaceae bacterium]|nr:hypothetical protein [Thermoleophilaceae bacterium]